MTPRRFASIAGTVAVTLIAAVGSYDHTRRVCEMAGQGPILSALLPISIDGLALVATVALGDGRARRGSAWAALLIAAGASLAANVMAAEPTGLARVVSAWPSAALLLCVEVIARAGRASAADTAERLNDSSEAPALDRLAAEAGRPVAALDRPATAVRKGVAVAGTARTLAEGSAARVAAVLAAEPHLSTGEVADRLGLSARSVRRYRPAKVAA